MKHLNLKETTNLGGHRFSVNDLEHLNEGSEQVGEALSKWFGEEGPGGRIISGVVKTEDATNVEYTGGWIIKDGKLWKVNPLPTTAKAPAYFVYFIFKEENTYPPVTYQSGSTYQVHQERTIDIVYQTGFPAGTYNVDWTSETQLVQQRLDTMLTGIASNTAHVADVNSPWTELDGSQIVSLVYSGLPSGIRINSRFRYKIIGKTAFFHMSLTMLAPSDTNFSIRFPVLLNIADTIHPEILALDTRNTQEPCKITIIPATTGPTVPALMTFARSHNNTDENTISFMASIELQ